MEKSQIKNYIEKYKSQYSRASIFTQLKNSGANEAEINSSFNEVELNSISSPIEKEKIKTNFIGFIKNSFGLYFGNFDKSFNYIKNVLFGKAFLYYWMISMAILGISILINPLSIRLINPLLLFLMITLGSFIGLILMIGIGLGIFHLLLMMFGGSGNYNDTVKFSLSVYIFPIIVNTIISVLLGLILGLFSTIYLTIIIIIGIIIFILIYYIMIKVQSKLHKISKLKVFIIILIPIILLALLFVGIFFMNTTTNENLQNKALKTGYQIQQSLNTGFSVFEVTVNDTSDGMINLGEDTISSSLQLSPGSDSIKLSEITVTMVTNSGNYKYKYDSTNAAGSLTTFGIKRIKPGTKSGYLTQKDAIKLNIISNVNINENEQFTLRFFPGTGNPFPVQIITPPKMNTVISVLK